MITLPSEAVTLNSLLLHCDVTGRPYRIDDFREAFERLELLGDVASFGAYQKNHVWLATFHSTTAKDRLLASQELLIKGKRCILIDPKNSEIRLKIHWVPYHVSDDTVRRALEKYGKVHEVVREMWRAQGFQGVQSTTRLVRITLKEGVNKERIPNQLRFFGGTALVSVPGRAPLCLRCEQTGHIRRDCRIPRCEDCHRFGHTKADCVRSYAAATAGPRFVENSDLVMDEGEAEQAASADTHESTVPGTSRAGGLPEAAAGTPSPEVERPLDAPSETSRHSDKAGPATETEATDEPTLDVAMQHRAVQNFVTPVDSAQDAEAMEVATTSSKRHLEQENSAEEELVGEPVQQRWKANSTKPGRLRPPKLRTSSDNRDEKAS
ncbi:uncharacterized protein ISCGN_007196 [Ixodes scapularis]